MPRPRIYDKNADRQRAYRHRCNHPTTTAHPISQAPGSYVTALEDLLTTGQRFGTIYADPPWLYDDQPPRGGVGDKYDTMPLEAICALPVQDLALPQAHLHLWVTKDFLFEAPRVLDAWGFTYKAQMVWVKTTKDGKQPVLGPGHYWRNSHETLILGVRGNLTARQKNLPSVFMSPRLTYSEKPEQVRDLVEQLSPGPYLELFGRVAIPGWTVWGNQQVPRTGRLFKDQVG